MMHFVSYMTRFNLVWSLVSKWPICELVSWHRHGATIATYVSCIETADNYVNLLKPSGNFTYDQV
jgi:hypothetical protein